MQKAGISPIYKFSEKNLRFLILQFFLKKSNKFCCSYEQNSEDFFQGILLGTLSQNSMEFSPNSEEFFENFINLTQPWTNNNTILPLS